MLIKYAVLKKVYLNENARNLSDYFNILDGRSLIYIIEKALNRSKELNSDSILKVSILI